MKKLIYSMFALAIMAMTFNSCEDVPAPYALPGDDDPVVIEPTGDGTLENPFNVAAALAYVEDLASDVEITQDIYVRGKVSTINTNYDQSDPQFGNAVFYISDDGKTTKQFYVYRALYLGNKKYTSGTTLQNGDEVIICGKLVNYRGTTPETVQNKAFLYSLNGVTEGGGEGGGEGKGSGTLDDPYDALGAANAVKNLTWTSNTEYDKTGDVYVKGKISRIADKGTFGESGTFGNATFYISEDGAENDEFYCFRVLYLGNKKYASGTDIKVGDEVIICGKLMNYRGNTPETVAGEAYLYSLNGVTDGGSGGGGEDEGGDGEAKGNGSKDNPYNAVAAANAVKNLTWTSNTEYDKTDDVYVKGKISRIANNGTFTAGGTYGNASFYISEDGSQTDEFYCFRILYFGNKKFESGQTDIKVGDEVVIYGKLMNYRGNTPETVANEAYLISLNGATDGGSGSGGEGGGDEGGDDDSSDGNSVSFATNSGSQTWAAATDDTYGSGFRTTTQGLNIGYYKHTSSSNPVSPNDNHVRVYKNSALIIASTDGKKIKKIVIGCAPNAGSTSYCSDMTGLEGGANATADKSALTVTWNGSASKVVLHANNTQVRMEKLTVVFE